MKGYNPLLRLGCQSGIDSHLPQPGALGPPVRQKRRGRWLSSKYSKLWRWVQHDFVNSLCVCVCVLLLLIYLLISSLLFNSSSHFWLSIIILYWLLSPKMNLEMICILLLKRKRTHAARRSRSAWMSLCCQQWFFCAKTTSPEIDRYIYRYTYEIYN